MLDTILEGDHPRIISAKFGWDWLSSFRGEDFFLIFIPPFYLFLAWRPSRLEVGITGHNFGRGPPKDHSTKVWLQLAQWFLRRRLKCEMLKDGRRTKSDGNSSHGLKARCSSETTEPISTKLCWNDPWVVPFQNCVQHFRPSTKMAATAEFNLT
jgi:hypothetical protein